MQHFNDAQGQDQTDISDSAYSSRPQSSQPSQNRSGGEEDQGQQGEIEEQQEQGREAPQGAGELDQDEEDSPLEQSLHTRKTGRLSGGRQTNDRVMNILKASLGTAPTLC